MLQFDHVNVRTANLERMVAFYETVLGMTSGWRPAFPFPGAWMYLGEQAYVHLVAVDSDPGAPKEAEKLRLEHFAFRGQDLEEFRQRVKDAGLDNEEARVPGTNLLQVNFFDPDGNHIHVDFTV
ncbi:MAG: VOC family protein [Kiloniellales bacterium]